MGLVTLLKITSRFSKASCCQPIHFQLKMSDVLIVITVLATKVPSPVSPTTEWYYVPHWLGGALYTISRFLIL